MPVVVQIALAVLGLFVAGVLCLELLHPLGVPWQVCALFFVAACLFFIPRRPRWP